MNTLDGNKTYILAGLLAVTGIISHITKSDGDVIKIIIEALCIMALRGAMKKGKY